MTAALTCTTWRHSSAVALEARALPLGAPGERCTLTLRALPGAHAVHLEIRDGDHVRLRAEIPVLPGDTLALDLAWGRQGQLEVSSPYHQVLRLPPDAKYAPPAPLKLVPGPRLDVALLLDGTTRRFTRPAASGRAWRRQGDVEPQTPAPTPPSPARGALWDDHAVELLRLVQELAGPRPELRVALLAFADQALTTGLPHDLQPAYVIHPCEAERRQFTRFDHDTCLRALDRLPASTGGDCVDALADALHACTCLHWRRAARKLLIVSGDSPGYSLLHPAPAGIDAGVRRHDVDTQAAALHAAGVEIATVFHAPPDEAALLPWQLAAVEFAREQYARLASRPELAFAEPRFDGAAAAAVLCREVPLLGRDAAYPEWCDDEPAQAAPAADAA